MTIPRTDLSAALRSARLTTIRLIVLAVFTSIVIDGDVASVPLLINYQGIVESQDTLIAITFSIYPDSSSGAAIWSESREVRPKGGRFDVLLGSVSTLEPSTFQVDDRYLALSIEGRELRPRHRIVSVPYALNARHAMDVAEQSIHPRSVSLSDVNATWDSTGMLATPLIKSDSLVIGSTPVIDGTGAWIGPAIAGQGVMSLRSITSIPVNETAIFFFNSKWGSFSQFDTFFEVPVSGTLDLSFAAQVSCSNPFKTRITLKQVAPSSIILGQVGNVAGSPAAGSAEGSTVHNQGVVEVGPGTYRIFVEHQSGSVIEGTLRSGSLIIRYYY